MSLIIPDDAAQVARQRDRMLRDAQDIMLDGAGQAIQDVLKQMRRSIRQQAGLTASVGDVRLTSDFLTLGQVSGWWEAAVDQRIIAQVQTLWLAGRTSASDSPVTSKSLDSVGEYLAIVRDRLSIDATPTLPQEAFNTVRVALVDELSKGSSITAITDRLGAELQWQGQDVGYWRTQQTIANTRLDAILDAAGPQFVTDAAGNRIENPVRRSLRLNDPTVRDLQRQSTEAGARILRDRSTWQVRAERIARTETTGAYNAGAAQAYAEERAQVKMWLCAPDARTRDWHLQANGQIVNLSEPFEVFGEMLMFPGDPSGSAENVINCRCTTIAGDSREQLEGIAMPAIEQVDFERALREDRDREALALEREQQLPQSLEIDTRPAAGAFLVVDDPTFGNVELLDLSDANVSGAFDPGAEGDWSSPEVELAVREQETFLLESYTTPEDFADSRARAIADAEEGGNLDTAKGHHDNLRMVDSTGSVIDETGDQLRALRGYQGAEYTPINNTLRDQRYDKLGENLTGIVDGTQLRQTRAEAIRNLDALMDAAPRTPAPIVSYRNVGFSSEALDLRQMPVGTVIRDRGYVSTTIKPIAPQQAIVPDAAAAAARLRITVPEGTPGVYLNAQGRRSAFAYERELLLPRGTIFEVTGQSADFIDVRVIGVARDVLP